MSARQRLRTRLGVRERDSICWSCAFGLRRYVSTVQQPGLGRKTYIEDPEGPTVLADTGQQLRREVISIGPTKTTNRLSTKIPFATKTVGQCGVERLIRGIQPTRAPKLSDRARQFSHVRRREGALVPNIKKSGHARVNVIPISFIRSVSSAAHRDTRLDRGAIQTRSSQHVPNPKEKSTLSLPRKENTEDANGSCKILQQRWQGSNIHFSTAVSESNKRHRGTYTVIQKRRHATAASPSSHTDIYVDPSTVGADSRLASTLREGNIREHLRLWQQQQVTKGSLSSFVLPTRTRQQSDSQNLSTQSGEDDSFSKVAPEDEADILEDDGFVAVDSKEPAPDILKNELFLKRGDLVELYLSKEPMLAIFVRNFARQCQFYTMRGQWLHRKTKNAKFCIPGFVQPDELNDILPYLPEVEIAGVGIDRLQSLDISAPRTAGAKLLAKMSRFYQASDRVFRENADRLNRTYEMIAPAETHVGKTVMTLGQIATTVLQKKAAELRPEMLWAVHRAIVTSQNIMLDTFNYRQNIRYEIHPRKYLVEINQVREWMREIQEEFINEITGSKAAVTPDMSKVSPKNPIAMFVQKARTAIQESRHTRTLAPNGCLGPSSVKVTPSGPSNRRSKAIDIQELSPNDRTIVHFIDAWAMSRYLNPYTNLQALGPMILRAVGMYEGFELAPSLGLTFLQELGIFPQWANRLLYQTKDLRLPDLGSASAEMNTLRTKAYEEADRLAPLQDSMKELRKDWGDLPVFCIDSAETVDRDDGVSFEPVEGSDDECWVHVHVANPSAYITPSSAAGKYAARISKAVYLPECKHPMIPPSLTENQLSLAKGRPCLTFSARLSKQGDILEKKIVHGIVRNVHYITRQTVGRNLGIDGPAQSDAITLLTVGEDCSITSKEQAHESFQALPDPYISLLRRLLEVSEAASPQRRASSTSPVLQSLEEATGLYPYVSVDFDQVKDGMIARYEGDPLIRLQKSTISFGPVAKMVNDLMVLAGEIAASWCMERNIPIPYRGMVRNPEPEIDPETFRSEIIDPQIAKHGYAYLPDLGRYMQLIGMAAVSASPLGHITLGLPAYCKATSPLRRYTDLYTHWQIEAAMRHEAATGSSLVGSTTDHSFLAFSRAEVEEYVSSSLHRERKLTKVERASERHWIVQAMFRAFYFKEVPLPDTFEVTAQEGFYDRYGCWLDGWSTKAYIEGNEVSVSNGGIREGDRWEAKIKDVNIYFKSIVMEPVRLLGRLPT